MQFSGFFLPCPVSLFELESIQRLAIDLVNEIAGLQGVGEREDRRLADADRERVEDAIGIMAKRFREDLGMGEIAQQVGISERQFYRIFKRYHGCGPREFLEEVRLRSGREILRNRPD